MNTDAPLRILFVEDVPADAVLAEGFAMDCNTIRGRSGLPWNRQL